MAQLGHPYAAQVKASQRRRLRALGATAGKSWGRASMDQKSSYPQTHAGTEREMTISGKSGHKRADRYARGGKVGKKGAKHVTNVVVASHPPAAPQDRPLPVPVPVGGGPAPGVPPRGAAPPPAGAPPALPPGGPPSPLKPPGMKSGGVLSPSETYHNWGKGYAHGGGVKKASGGMIGNLEKDMGGQSKRAYTGYPHSPTKEVASAVSPTKRGGAVKKRARGGDVGKHDDEAADRKLFGKMIKQHEKEEGEEPKRKSGGPVKKAHGGLVQLKHAGSGSGEGRLAKSKMARKVPAHTEA